jgi:septum formation protein
MSTSIEAGLLRIGRGWRIIGLRLSAVKEGEHLPITTPPLVLASSSRYRRELLERFGLPFKVDSPAVDETPEADESPRDMALRLAVAKARAVAARHTGALVIGSDQAAALGGKPLGKPGTASRAVAQLLACSGRSVDFFTAVALLHAPSGRLHTHVDRTRAHFRRSTEREIQRYVAADRPLDCAGGIKFEARGALLLDKVETADPSAGIGLPLIRLGAMLRAEGVNPLA